MEPIVQTQGLGRRFGKRWAYAHVDLEIQEGERFLIAGSNGSGKTTLLRTLSTGLMSSRGSLHLFGQRPETDRWQLRHRIGMLSHATGLYEDLSARQNLEVYARIIGKKAPVALLDRVGLDDRPDAVRTYSAGMRKRLAMAVLLLQEPALVLLDEPYGQLDPAGMDQMTKLIAGIEGTVVISSHQLERASALCDRALVLNQGVPRWSGPASSVLAVWDKVHPGEAA